MGPLVSLIAAGIVRSTANKVRCTLRWPGGEETTSLVMVLEGCRAARSVCRGRLNVHPEP